MSKRLKIEFEFDKNLPREYLEKISNEIIKFVKNVYPDLPIEKYVIDWSSIDLNSNM